MFILDDQHLKGSGIQLLCRNQQSTGHINFPVEIIYGIVKQILWGKFVIFFSLICMVSVRMITDRNTVSDLYSLSSSIVLSSLVFIPE